MQYKVHVTITPGDHKKPRTTSSQVVTGESYYEILRAVITELLHSTNAGMRAVPMISHLNRDFGQPNEAVLVLNKDKPEQITYNFDLIPFVSNDPVTKESLWAWAETQAVELKTTPEDILACVLGRLFWRGLDGQDSNDLKMMLHDIAMDGDASKPYNDMTKDELLAQVFEEVVPMCEADYNAEEHNEPFGLRTMIEADQQLWEDE